MKDRTKLSICNPYCYYKRESDMYASYSFTSGTILMNVSTVYLHCSLITVSYIMVGTIIKGWCLKAEKRCYLISYSLATAACHLCRYT